MTSPKVEAYIEGYVLAHPLLASRLRMDVVLYNRTTEPVYVTAIKLLCDGVEKADLAVYGQDVDEIADDAGLGVLGPSFYAPDVEFTRRGRLKRKLTIPGLIDAVETLRGRLVATVELPDDPVADSPLGGDWTVRAEYEEKDED